MVKILVVIDVTVVGIKEVTVIVDGIQEVGGVYGGVVGGV